MAEHAENYMASSHLCFASSHTGQAEISIKCEVVLLYGLKAGERVVSNAAVKLLYLFWRCKLHLHLWSQCAHRQPSEAVWLIRQQSVLKTFCAYLYPLSGEGGVHPGHVDSSSLSSDCNQTNKQNKTHFNARCKKGLWLSQQETFSVAPF